MNNNSAITLTNADSSEQIDVIRELFLEYGQSLDFNLCFQSFDEELKSLPGKYEPPQGRLVLAAVGGKTAGCVALCPVADGVCEMKRLWVRPEFRGIKLGRRLAEHIMNEARSIGYEKMKLDTVKTMTSAISLYKSLGFTTTSAYRYNPVEGAIYMEIDLGA